MKPNSSISPFNPGGLPITSESRVARDPATIRRNFGKFGHARHEPTSYHISPPRSSRANRTLVLFFSGKPETEPTPSRASLFSCQISSAPWLKAECARAGLKATETGLKSALPGLCCYVFWTFGASGETVDELFTAIEMPPIGRRTNEAKRGGFNRFGEVRVCRRNEIEFFELLLFEGAALGLYLAELLQGLEQPARQARFVES